MKSPSTLIALHTRASCVLEFLQSAEIRLQQAKKTYAEYNKPYQDQSCYMRVSRKQKGEYINDIITANRVYCRIKKNYINILKQIQIA